MDRVNLGFVGLGGRGAGLADLVADMEDVHIPAVCDVYQDRVDGYTDYRAMLARGDLQGVVIATSWTTHVEIGLAATRAGIYAAVEVGGAS